MIKVYGSKLCPDCVNFTYDLDRNNISYEYIDITGSMKNLKEFLKLRDEAPIYENTKKNGGVGIPTIVFEDGRLDLDWEGYLAEQGIEKSGFSNAGNACRLDGSGC